LQGRSKTFIKRAKFTQTFLEGISQKTLNNLVGAYICPISHIYSLEMSFFAHPNSP
jgi:hypothetical protein